MDELLIGWTAERVTLLAPDTASAKSGRRLAAMSESGWRTLAHDGYTVWGQYQGTGKSPYEVKADLLKLQKDEHNWHCTCPSRKSPCKHVLGLLYRVVEHGAMIPQLETPEYVKHWLSEAAQRARKEADRQRRTQDNHAEREQDRQKRYLARKAKITAGLEELEQWLINMMRRGLADPQVQSYEFWDSRAERMVDAQAPGIATWLRDLGGLPHQGTNWIEPLLDQLGRMYLVVESFKRFDSLPEGVQADLRSVLGWHYKRSDIPNEGGIEDQWYVIGCFRGEMSERLRTQRVWLRGKQSGRDALIQEFAFGDALFETHLQPGWAFDARMVFYPSSYPLRAFIGKRYTDVSRSDPLQGQSIMANLQSYSHALAQNPWLPQFPFLLDGVIVNRYGGNWVIHEEDRTHLTLSRHFQHEWSLMALSGGHPIQIAGEWDGEQVFPVGAVVDGRFVDFGMIGKI